MASVLDRDPSSQFPGTARFGPASFSIYVLRERISS